MKKSIVTLEETIVDAAQIQAYNVLRSKKIPPGAKSTRPGKAGKTFTYLSHVWVTQTLQKGLGNLWDFGVVDWEVWTETISIKRDNIYVDVPVRSIAAKCYLHLYILIDPAQRQPGDPLFFVREFTEVGVFEPNPGMTTAAGVASAVSRGLCKAVARSIGLGLELYGDDGEDISPDKAWTSLKQFAINQGVKWSDGFQSEFIAALKKGGITKENIVDMYSKAYEVLAEMLGKTVKIEDMPE